MNLNLEILVDFVLVIDAAQELARAHIGIEEEGCTTIHIEEHIVNAKVGVDADVEVTQCRHSNVVLLIGKSRVEVVAVEITFCEISRVQILG